MSRRATLLIPLLLIALLLFGGAVTARQQVQGEPFRALWIAISNVQQQLAAIELLPGPRGPQGDPGPAGPAAPTTALGRIAYVDTESVTVGAQSHVTVTGRENVDVLVLNVQSAGEAGTTALVKLDAVVQVVTAGGVDIDGIVLRIVHDASSKASVPVTFNSRAARGNLTWGARVSSGQIETFTLRAAPNGTQCLGQFFQCVTYFVRAQMSAITVPFGSSQDEIDQ